MGLLNRFGKKKPEVPDGYFRFAAFRVFPPHLHSYPVP